MKSPLHRIGNKSKLLPKLLEIFPDRPWAFIDLFMGTGNVALAMAVRARYVFANDSDNDVFNLFYVLKERRADFIEALKTIPYHESLFKHWKNTTETDRIWQAIRFLYLSNFSQYGMGTMCRLTDESSLLILRQDAAGLSIPENISFLHRDFREVLSKNLFHHADRNIPKSLLYADPPYLDTGHNYQDGFTEEDMIDLFGILEAWEGPWALSAFLHPFILDWQHKHDWELHTLGERRTLKSRQTEVVLTNYHPRRQGDLFRT